MKVKYSLQGDLAPIGNPSNEQEQTPFPSKPSWSGLEICCPRDVAPSWWLSNSNQVNILSHSKSFKIGKLNQTINKHLVHKHLVQNELLKPCSQLNVTRCFKWPSPWAYIWGRKLLETLEDIYTKLQVEEYGSF